MIADFEAIVRAMSGPATASRATASGATASGPLPLIETRPWLTEPDREPLAALTAALIVTAAGAGHPDHDLATAVLDHPSPTVEPEVGRFYREAGTRIRREIERAGREDASLDRTMRAAATALRAPALERDDVAEALWSVFCPEATGIRGFEPSREAALRADRTVTLVSLATDPIRNPAGEVLFTANVLLTLPAASVAIEDLPYPEAIRDALVRAADEPQRHWFDHPVQIGVAPEANEILYGLRGLDAAVAFEHGRGSDGRVTCLLSLSVTHDGLGTIARDYVEAELRRDGGLRHLDVLAVTEADARCLVDEVLAPAIGRERPDPDADDAMRAVFGVDGDYGRHYSFLKAIAGLWHVLVDPAVRATFKIDLDQVFPQDVLVAETGQSAFEHLASARWGARGLDATGREVELGMVAGALVNQRDIGRGLHTPDVAYPPPPTAPEAFIFPSALPQALSTRAEMMERYLAPPRDGVALALERVHVTGGTNGIRVDALRRWRPFCPTFIGRAEDQAYLLSVLGSHGPRPAYVHEPGLVMRHDKEAFAGEAIAAAHVGKLIGDDVRILQFSASARAVGSGGGSAIPGDPLASSADLTSIKRLLDPFTGAFVSRLPVTVALLRFAFRGLGMFRDGSTADGRTHALVGARRLAATLALTGDAAAVRAALDRERAGWMRYYDALDVLERGIAEGDPSALRARDRARAIVERCRIRAGPPGEAGGERRREVRP
jgi:hypothetical protein